MPTVRMIPSNGSPKKIVQNCIFINFESVFNKEISKKNIISCKNNILCVFKKEGMKRRNWDIKNRKIERRRNEMKKSLKCIYMSEQLGHVLTNTSSSSCGIYNIYILKQHNIVHFV